MFSYDSLFMSFGFKPINYISREKEEKLVISEFSSPNPPNYVYLITGARGSGKTVLLSSISNFFSNEKSWIVIDSSVKSNMIEHLTSEIYEKGKVKKLFIKKEFSFSFKGITFSLEGKNPVTNVVTLLEKMLDELKKQGIKVLVTIDEVDNSNEMKLFVEAYQSLIRKGYQILCLMTGLYENISKLQEEKSLTFLYRAPKIYLSYLSLNSISLNYQKYLKVDEETSFELARLTKGYAYGYQLLGYLFFELKSKKIDADLLSKYDFYLSEYVYDKVYSELSFKEKEIVKAIGSNKEIKINDLISKLAMDIKYFSVYRDRLIKKGVLFSPSYGYVEFSFPRFNDFLRFKF